MSSARRLNLNMKEEEVTRDIMVVIANFPGKAYQVIRTMKDVHEQSKLVSYNSKISTLNC